MSACEECWIEASRKALLLGGHTVDRYRDELAAHPEHEPKPVTIHIPEVELPE